ncbi:tape measure protein [Lederbergia wuyishanensis]|uniref:Tape measure domain-containing protein n=1 Tax=Lederbergia wuyishanensis TaxID=1347903 RepID=A0ABU0D725_9BACI|nr:tape measure protein [Lederbergia wuyishanensis]MCJ8008897.1 tape measure protein [Lederbergia wuyishanensis]MDQ0344222.1 tape measure domain-containing protein [Lederbergia wuyishanensis]
MAGVQTTLALQDKLTGPLMKMMRALDSTVRVMEKMDAATSNLDQKSLASARRNISNASADLERLSTASQNAGNSANKAASQQDRFNNAVNQGLPGIGKLTVGILSAVGAYKMFNAAKNFFTDTFSRGVEFHAFKQSSEIAFTTFLGDAEKAKKYMDDMYAFALKTPFAYPDLLASSRNLIAFGIEAEKTFPIMQAIGDAVAAVGGSNAEMQNMADIFGIIQAQGRITAMEVNRLSSYGVNAYEILGKAAGVSANEMKKQISSGAVGAGQAIAGLVEGINQRFGGLMEGVKGTWSGAIDSMNSARRNVGVKLMQDFMEAEGPLVTLVNNVTEFLKKIPIYIGPAVSAFLPLIEMFNNTFSGNRFDGILSAIGASITFTANVLSWFGQLALWVAGIFADNWSWIAPIVTVIGSVLATFITLLITYYSVLGIIRLATLAWAFAQMEVNKAFLTNPIVWIILAIVAVIALVIYAMVNWGEQTAAVMGFIAGIFMVAVAFIGNLFVTLINLVIDIIAVLWNHFANFAEFFANVFNDPIGSVVRLFAGMADSVLSILEGIASAIDSLFGSNLANAVSGWRSSLSGKVIDLVGEAKVKIPRLDPGSMKLDRFEYGKAFDAGNKFGKSASLAATDKLTGAMNKVTGLFGDKNTPNSDINDISNLMDTPLNASDSSPGGKAAKNNPTGGKLDSIGKINDDINIADEDIKLMRDLAEKKSIQNFVTLTPTVTLTGDMNLSEEADVDEIIKKIEKTLTDDVARSAEGVFS